MKNSDMAVTLLLDEKQKVEEEVARTKQALDSLYGKFGKPNDNFGGSGTVGIYSSCSEFRFTAAKEVMISAAETMLEMQKKELEPIAKKLEAIELMLNS